MAAKEEHLESLLLQYRRELEECEGGAGDGSADRGCAGGGSAERGDGKALRNKLLSVSYFSLFGHRWGQFPPLSFSPAGAGGVLVSHHRKRRRIEATSKIE